VTTASILVIKGRDIAKFFGILFIQGPEMGN